MHFCLLGGEDRGRESELKGRGAAGAGTDGAPGLLFTEVQKRTYLVIMQQVRGQMENSFIPYEGEFTSASDVYDSLHD